MRVCVFDERADMHHWIEQPRLTPSSTPQPTSGAAMLFLPECFSFIGSKWQETVATGEPLTGPCISHMQTMAREHQLWLSLGGFNEKPLSGPEDGTGAGQEKVYNSHLIIDNKGGIRAVYRKIHLFDVVRPSRQYRSTNRGPLDRTPVHTVLLLLS